MENVNAPVVLFVYNRPWHTEQTLGALTKNKLADKSILHIFCDGPKESASQDQIGNIQKVREVVKKQQWCGEVIINESEENRGLAASIRNGVTDIVQRYGKVIVIEDDLITSPAFLVYMNKALNFYEGYKSVFSISAHSLPPTKFATPENYKYDVFVGLRNSSWGWGTWADRWEQVDWQVSAFHEMQADLNIQQAFNRRGDDVFEMLQKQQNGELDIWSIQFTVAHFVNHAVSIIPTRSYVDNIGLDGSGENCSISETMKNDVLCDNEDIRFINILYEDKRIINSFYSAHCRKKRPLWQKICNRLGRIFLNRNIFLIKKKILN